MGAQAPVWMPVIFAPFGTLVVVVFTAWLNSRIRVGKVESVRAELSGKIDTLLADVSGNVNALREEMKESMQSVSFA